MVETTPTIPRRKRFQFSLRTLMIAVLVYGLLWLITLKLGGRVVAQAYAAKYPNDTPVIDSDNTLQLTHPPPSSLQMSPVRYRGRVIAPAPFVLWWQWEKAERGLDYKTMADHRDWLVWVPGYCAAWGKPKLPYVDLVQIWYSNSELLHSAPFKAP